jgi:hypothetical protein
MNRFARTPVALSLALCGAACDSFLTGPGLTENPNNPTDARTSAQLLAIQANMFTRLQGQLARSAGIYTQQIIGSNNQQQIWGTRYLVAEGDISGQLSGFYTGAGLVGLREVQARARAEGNALIEGIAKIWEGYAFGTATSIWGDLPYSEANNPDILTPKLDSQEAIYDSVQQRLDEGIALLAAAPTAGNCDPAEADLIYCATAGPRAQQIARWVAAANTLKARFYLHLVEREGNAAYQAALTAAQSGILEAPASPRAAMHGEAPGDFRTFHGTTTADGNIWAQFLNGRQDLVAGHTLVQILKDRNDPRLTAYFDPNAQGGVYGVSADEVTMAPTGQAASVVNTAVRRQLNFRQPLVTWVENQLIMAEAKHRLGDIIGALGHVNSVRAAVGGLPALGTVTFQDVMLEKYIAMFQNIDVWSDFKRTCIPLLKPYASNTEVPGRLPYGSAERTANPNLPLPAAYPEKTTGSAAVRNWNDPDACPRPS